MANPSLVTEKKVRKLVSADKTVAYVWDNKLHNWEGPAYIPQGNRKKAEYHINGIQYSKKEWEALRRDRTGLPWFKQAAYKERK